MERMFRFRAKQSIRYGCHRSQEDEGSSIRAREFGESDGFIKVIIDAETNRVLGAFVLASQGAELAHMYVDLMNADTPYTVIRDAIHIHPTLAEAVQSAVKSFE